MQVVGKPIRVLLVGGYRVALLGLETLVESKRPMMEVTATATSSEQACQLTADSTPDVVVLDPEGRGLTELIPQLVNSFNTRVIVLIGERDQGMREDLVLRGASGVVHKDEAPEILLRAIEKVHSGELWIDRSTVGKLFVVLSRGKSALTEDTETRRLASLTQREQDVVRKLASEPGADNKRLARSLHIGEHTLRNHLSRIYDKLGVGNRVELFVFAQRNGLRAHSQPALER